MKRKLSIVLIIFFSMLIFVSCSENKINNDNKKEHKTMETNQNTKQNDSKEITNIQTNLFPNNKKYDGISEKTINIHNKEKKVKFVEFSLRDYGIYISDILNVIKHEDGNEIGFDLGKTINLMPFKTNFNKVNGFKDAKKLANEFIRKPGTSGPGTVTQDEDLKNYKEYLGSKIKYGLKSDFFLFFYDNKNSAIIRLYYAQKDKSTTLPIFLEEIRNIKYIPNIDN